MIETIKGDVIHLLLFVSYAYCLDNSFVAGSVEERVELSRVSY